MAQTVRHLDGWMAGWLDGWKVQSRRGVVLAAANHTGRKLNQPERAHCLFRPLLPAFIPCFCADYLPSPKEQSILYFRTASHRIAITCTHYAIWGCHPTWAPLWNSDRQASGYNGTRLNTTLHISDSVGGRGGTQATSQRDEPLTRLQVVRWGSFV
jgi:hypothetical protein